MTLSLSGASMAMRGNLAAAVDQCVQREVDPGGNDPTLIGAREIDHVEGRRGSEIDHDQVAWVTSMGSDGVQDAVGADGARLGDIKLDAPARRALPGNRLE